MRNNMLHRIKTTIGKDDQNIHSIRLILLLVLIFIVASILKPDNFLTTGNFIAMSRQFPEYGLLAIGLGLTILIGGIDLSVVSIANLSAILTAKFMLSVISEDMSAGMTIGFFIISILICLIIGLLAGLINSLLISKAGITPILATLGTQQLFMGFSIVITRGSAVSGLPSILTKTINTSIAGFIPVVLIIFIVCAIIVGIMLSKTKTGARLYLLGSNPIATKFSGINNDRLTMLAYMISGVLAAVAGIIMMGRSNSVKADYGLVYTLQAVLIAVLGGVDPKGGKGKIQGIVLAVILLQLMSSILNMYQNISNFYRDVLWGGLLILVLIFNYLMKKREKSMIKRT